MRQCEAAEGVALRHDAAGPGLDQADLPIAPMRNSRNVPVEASSWTCFAEQLCCTRGSTLDSHTGSRLFGVTPLFFGIIYFYLSSLVRLRNRGRNTRREVT